jgi:DNA-directed RNA polymerase specialized sigma24 family protein
MQLSGRNGRTTEEKRKMEKITAKITGLTTEMLKDMAARLTDDFRDGADLVQSAVLDALMSRLPEAEFVAFCEAL